MSTPRPVGRTVECDSCGDQLDEAAAILLAPAESGGEVFVCRDCHGDATPAESPATMRERAEQYDFFAGALERTPRQLDQMPQVRAIDPEVRRMLATQAGNLRERAAHWREEAERAAEALTPSILSLGDLLLPKRSPR